jgi:hypothetical protein
MSSIDQNRLYREARVNLSGYFIKNTEDNLHFLKLFGSIIQQVTEQPEYFLFYTEEDDGIFYQWTIGLNQQNIDSLSYENLIENVQIDNTKELSIDILLNLIKNDLYVFSSDNFTKRKRLNKSYKLKVDFDWLEDIEYLSINEGHLKTKYIEEWEK